MIFTKEVGDTVGNKSLVKRELGKVPIQEGVWVHCFYRNGYIIPSQEGEIDTSFLSSYCEERMEDWVSI